MMLLVTELALSTAAAGAPRDAGVDACMAVFEVAVKNAASDACQPFKELSNCLTSAMVNCLSPKTSLDAFGTLYDID